LAQDCPQLAGDLHLARDERPKSRLYTVELSLELDDRVRGPAGIDHGLLREASNQPLSGGSDRRNLLRGDPGRLAKELGCLRIHPHQLPMEIVDRLVGDQAGREDRFKPRDGFRLIRHRARSPAVRGEPAGHEHAAFQLAVREDVGEPCRLTPKTP